MVYPALSIRQPNIGQSLLQAEQIKGVRSQNRLAEAKMERENALSGLRQDILGGGGASAPSGAPRASQAGTIPVDALKKYMALDPPGGKALYETLSSMEEDKRKQLSKQNEIVSRLLLQVESLPAEQRPMAYQQARQMAQEMGIPVDNAPEQYNPQWMQLGIARGMATDQILSQQKSARDERKPLSAAGKLASDLERGLISPEQYQTEQGIRSKPLVSMTNRQETETQKAYGKEIGKYYAETYTGMQQAAREARNQNARLDRLDQLLEQTKTGSGMETITDIKRIGQTFNIPGIEDLPGDVEPAEAARALSSEMALQLRSPEGGAGMPGAMSDKDREFLQAMVPNLGLTREGRKLLIDARKKVNQRNIEVARMAREYQRENGQLDAGFEDELSEYAENNPLFTKEDMNMREKARLPSVADEDFDYGSIPSGTYFIDDEGNTRQKP